ncbi:MAG: hypothetical protein AAGL49_05500, partial [Pseudomonadota bacterium]
MSDFYVGYASTPPRTKALMLTLAPLLVLLAAGVGLLLSTEQAGTGEGQWLTSAVATIEGRLVAEPYPAILIPNEAGGAPETVFLSTVAKMVPTDRMQGLIGRDVAADGILVERDGRRLLAVNDGDSAIRAAEGISGEARLDIEPIGAQTLRGEIIDPKCWYGVMKPGEGKTHKACATLCLFGGIAPLFKTVGPAGQELVYVLTNAD